MDAPTDRSALVPGSHRLIRVLEGAEGPFRGALVSCGDGVAVSVDTKELTGWGGWAFSDSEHVCGVIDVRRRTDGHDALLPWCTQRVDSFLGRRLMAQAPLTAGELGTLVVSLLRGVSELGVEAAATTGEWWLTGEGRPLFVLGEGGAVRVRTAALVERVAEHTEDRATTRVLDEVIAALRERRHHGDKDAGWEAQLFAVAAPRALRIDVFSPERAADLVPSRPLRLDVGDTRRLRRERERSHARETLVQRLDALRVSLAERMHGVLARLRREESRGRSKREAGTPSRRRPLIVAASLAAVVLLAGLLWPGSQEPDPATAQEASSAEDVSAPVASPEPEAMVTTPAAAGEVPSDPVPEGDADALSAVPALLDVIAECAEQGLDACPDATIDGVVISADALLAQGSGGSAAELMDDYGDVAVVKLSPVGDESSFPAQMLVLERRERKWLVRDVYDVAHQPG